VEHGLAPRDAALAVDHRSIGKPPRS
jgi:hypothetical protein